MKVVHERKDGCRTRIDLMAGNDTSMPRQRQPDDDEQHEESANGY